MTFSLVPASYLYLRRGDEVLLQLRHGTGYMDGHWAAGAAGHVEPGETAVDAIVREAREELGIAVDPRDLTAVTVMQRRGDVDALVEQRVDWFFTARRWAGEPRVLEPAKSAGLAWHPLDALPTPVPAYELLALGLARDGATATLSFDGFEGR